MHVNYPLYTPGGADRRWLGTGPLEEHGRHWVGPVLITAQLMSATPSPVPIENELEHGLLLQDIGLVAGPGKNHYAAFTWEDFDAIAPWMADYTTRRIDGAGLGN